jgi:phosphoglucosamine mutase
MARLFGTDGIRSKANQWPLTADFVLKVGQAAARTTGRRGDARPQVVIGRDPRQSGCMLESALAAGLMAEGVNVMLVGVIPTPGVAYLTCQHEAQQGVVISASHNPFDDNGIKIFGPDGFKIPDETELEIERLLLDSADELKGVDGQKLGRSWDAGHWREEYIHHFTDVWGEDRFLQSKRVVLDCSNGATSEIAPEVFRRLGADVITMENAPDGFNINEHYEYIRPESLRAAVLRERALVGLAFDGDGDRLMLVDEKGGFVNGDAMMAILARDLKRKGLLAGDTVVATAMSNWGLKASLEEVSLRLEEAPVGDRFILQRMLEQGYTLGGEQSGHIILLQHGQTTGDGIYTALAVLKVVESAPGQTLSELAACIREFPEYLTNVNVASKPPLDSIPEVQEALKRLRAALGENVDITLRYSGTENKLRLKIRAGLEHSSQTLEREAETFMAVAKRAIK